MNDTVVVYDRVRENLRKFKKMNLIDLLDKSVNQTLSRTINTTVTTILALGALYFIGGQIIADFAFAMLWGIVVGTYSSVFIAATILIYLNVRSNQKTINMDLELYPNISAPIIEGYGHGYVNISGNKLTKTFILFPDKFIELDFENIKEITNAVNLCKIQLDLIIYGSLNSLDKSKYLNLKSSILFL